MQNDLSFWTTILLFKTFCRSSVKFQTKNYVMCFGHILIVWEKSRNASR